MEVAKKSQEFNKLVDNFKKSITAFVKAKTRSPIPRAAVMYAAASHGLIKQIPNLMNGKNVSDLENWINNVGTHPTDGFTLNVDIDLLFNDTQSYYKMSYSTFMMLYYDLKSIMTIERNRSQFNYQGKKLSFEQVVNDLDASIRRNNAPKEYPVIGSINNNISTKKKIVNALSKIFPSLTKAEFLFEILDGGPQGELWNKIYKPISDAEDKRTERVKTERDNVQNILDKHYTKKEIKELFGEKIFFPTIGKKGTVLTREEIIIFALNTGNEENVKRLFLGKNFNGESINEQDFADILAKMRTKDWNFVNDIWAYLGTFKQEAFDLEERLNGIAPREVLPTPYTIVSADGDTINVTGGYFPIVYDPSVGTKASEQKDVDDIASMFNTGTGTGAMHGAGHTKQGHLKARGSMGYGTPLLFKFSALYGHMHNVINDLTMREVMIDTHRLIKNKQIMNTIQEVVGQQYYRILDYWLKSVVREELQG
jgi:hypothetical protein